MAGIEEELGLQVHEPGKMGSPHKKISVNGRAGAPL
jgi:hypothetical protein